MSKSVQEIKNEMIVVKDNENTLTDLNSTSKVSVWNLFLFIIAFCFQDLRSYFDAHRDDVIERLNNQKSCTLAWYRTKALAFQYGFDLITDTDVFDIEGAAEATISASKIIKYAAVNDGDTPGTIVIKVATESNEKLSQITAAQKTSLEAYFAEIKAAGDKISIINYIADKLFLTFQIHIDPLVLNQTGVSILNGNKPVEDAILEFMKELPFNGELVLQSLVDKIQQVEGVKIAHLVAAKSSWLNVETQLHGTPTLINVKRIPESGYFEVENYDDITYVV